MRRHGCAATSAVTCAECCRVTSTMTATQVLTIGFALQYPCSPCGAPDAEATSGWEFSRLERLPPSKNLAALFSRHSAPICGFA